jgi:hypothetical protein
LVTATYELEKSDSSIAFESVGGRVLGEMTDKSQSYLLVEGGVELRGELILIVPAKVRATINERSHLMGCQSMVVINVVEAKRKWGGHSVWNYLVGSDRAWKGNCAVNKAALW